MGCGFREDAFNDYIKYIQIYMNEYSIKVPLFEIV